MLPGGISADLNHSQTAACFKSQPCRFHISLIYFIWRQTVAGFRRDGWDQWAVVLPTVDQFFIRQTHSIIVENIPFRFSVVSFSLRRQRPLPPPQKKQRVATCLLHSFIISLVCWRWSRCRTTWLRLHDHLRCEITGLAPRHGLNASLPLFLLCRPLRCLTFTADSIISAVWVGIKRDVLPAHSPTYWTSSCTTRATEREEGGRWTVSFCQNFWHAAFCDILHSCCISLWQCLKPCCFFRLLFFYIYVRSQMVVTFKKLDFCWKQTANRVITS